MLWVFPDPDAVLAAWVAPLAPLAPAGRLLLVEGHWSSGAGLGAREGEALVRRHRRDVQIRLLPEPAFWGGEVSDERYLLVSER